MGSFEEKRKAMHVTTDKWHKRLGHASEGKLGKLDFLKNIASSFKNKVCDSCSKAKHTMSFFFWVKQKQVNVLN